MNRSLVAGNLRYEIRQYGDDNGFPVFYFHGFPGSRLDLEIFNMDDAALKHKLRIIAIDRPGCGNSMIQQHRTLLDWPDAVTSIAATLNIKKFSVIGLSGGGPYALACAYKIPQLLHSVIVLSGMGPYDFKESRKDIAMLLPKSNNGLKKIMAQSFRKAILHFPALVKNVAMQIMPDADKTYFKKEDKSEKLIATFRESLRNGIVGYLQDADIYRNYWRFDLKDIKCKIQLWHGTSDKNVSLATAKRLVKELPDCTFTFIENQGHFSLTGNNLDIILSSI
jgi:pimeloyl-ACP methyl ester carboxylesterase